MQPLLPVLDDLPADEVGGQKADSEDEEDEGDDPEPADVGALG